MASPVPPSCAAWSSASSRSSFFCTLIACCVGFLSALRRTSTTAPRRRASLLSFECTWCVASFSSECTWCVASFSSEEPPAGSSRLVMHFVPHTSLLPSQPVPPRALPTGWFAVTVNASCSLGQSRVRARRVARFRLADCRLCRPAGRSRARHAAQCSSPPSCSTQRVRWARFGAQLPRTTSGGGAPTEIGGELLARADSPCSRRALWQDSGQHAEPSKQALTAEGGQPLCCRQLVRRRSARCCSAARPIHQFCAAPRRASLGARLT